MIIGRGGKFHGDAHDIYPGQGGKGGNVGSPQDPIVGPNGGPGKSGVGVVARSGDGGQGGDGIYVGGGQIDGEIGHTGTGGPPGSIYVVAGNGGEPNCDGGRVGAHVGATGKSGRGEFPPADPVPAAEVDIRGGNANPGPALSESDPGGGRGGKVDVYTWGGSSGIDLVQAHAVVTATAAGNGGAGLISCPEGHAGGVGGPGGTLTVHGARSVVTSSFNGGNGGDGNGPGGGGPGGQHDADAKSQVAGSFENGKPGTGCPQVGVRITETDTWSHNASIGKSNVCLNVGTSPPQTYVSGELTGPGGFDEKTNGKAPLHADGTAQIRATITQAGSYTDTLAVYGPDGTQTATSTNTFTVTPPPDNGPTTNPPCPAPTN